MLAHDKAIYLGDAALHDEEVRVVDVELHRVEEVLHLAGLHRVPVDHVLVLAADDHLLVRIVGSGRQG